MNPMDSHENHERSAAGLDFDVPLKEHAEHFGRTLAQEGPGALLDQVEELIPPAVREQIQKYPLFAVALGVAAGVYLGLNKGEEILQAGATLLTAAAMSQVPGAQNRG